MKNKRRLKKIIIFYIIACFIATIEAVLTANHLVSHYSSQVYYSVKEIPFHEAALVLGAPDYSRGRSNPVFAGRIQAAADLYYGGKVKKLIVSGICRPEKFYDEVSAMEQGLIALGIPPEAILKDNKGVKTLESVLRMRDSFGYNSFIIVSQRDHCCRALYLAKKNNISAVGFEAGIPAGLYPDEVLASLIRESLARVKTVLDIVSGHVKEQ